MKPWRAWPDAVLMSRPPSPCLRMRAIASWQQRNTPLVFTAMTLSQSSRVIFREFFRTAMPVTRVTVAGLHRDQDECAAPLVHGIEVDADARMVSRAPGDRGEVHAAILGAS